MRVNSALPTKTPKSTALLFFVVATSNHNDGKCTVRRGGEAAIRPYVGWGAAPIRVEESNKQDNSIEGSSAGTPDDFERWSAPREI